MESPASPPPPPRLEKLPSWLQWCLLLLVSVLVTGLLKLAALPAVLLIGPMLAAVLAGINGATITIPKPAFAAAQAVIGCLIAANMEPGIIASFADDWLLVRTP